MLRRPPRSTRPDTLFPSSSLLLSLPIVRVEEQSHGLACLATMGAAIPELVDDGGTGVLAPPDNPAALAAAPARLIADPAERRRLGAAGQQRVRADFDMKSGIDTLARLLRSAAGTGDVARTAAE